MPASSTIPADIVEQRQKKRYLRTEATLFQESKPFTQSFNEQNLFNYLIEIAIKAGNLLSCVSALGRPADQMRIIEMSLNREDIMLDKSKILFMKLEKIYVIIPFTLAKIEVRMRNMIINMRPKFEAISRFTQVYLDVYQEQSKAEKKAEQVWLEEQRKKDNLSAVDPKGASQASKKTAGKKQGTVVPFKSEEEGRAEAAKQVGIDQPQISEYESGSQVNLLKKR